MKVTDWFTDGRYSREKFSYLIIVQLKTPSHLTAPAAGESCVSWIGTLPIHYNKGSGSVTSFMYSFSCI